MARGYGRIISAIWNDPEFRALSGAAQRAYLMLISQSDVTSAGTLPLTVKRWSSYAVDTTADAVSDALSELEGRRFLLVDGETEEVLIRKFVKWDGGWSNAKRRPAITSAANAATSPKIRAALAVELDALGIQHALSDALSDAIPDRASDTPRFQGTEGEYVPEPETRNLKPGTVAHAAPTAQTIIGEWIDRCRERPPKRVIGQVAKLVDEMLAEGIDPDDVRRGVAAWMGKGLHPATLPSVVNEVMNTPRAVNGTQSAKAAGWLAIAHNGGGSP